MLRSVRTLGEPRVPLASGMISDAMKILKIIGVATASCISASPSMRRVFTMASALMKSGI
jgi:hypothetical protein